MDARTLLVSNLALVERAIAFTCRRAHLDEAEAQEFASVVRLKLVENDYAIVRKFEGRSSFATYISVVIQRLLLDHRIHLFGKWHPSAEARRLGPAAVELEKLLHRDGRSVEEAAPMMPALSRTEVDLLASRLPPPRQRRRDVDLSEAEAVADRATANASFEDERSSAQISSVVRQHLDAAGAEDRLILQLHFNAGMSLAAIARSLHIDQKQLYRRLEKHLRDLRGALERAGIGPTDATNLIDNPAGLLDFGLAAEPSRKRAS